MAHLVFKILTYCTKNPKLMRSFTPLRLWNSVTSPSFCVSVVLPSFLCTPVLGNTIWPVWCIKHAPAGIYSLMLAPDWLPDVWLSYTQCRWKTHIFLYSCIPRPVLHVRLYFSPRLIYSKLHGSIFFMRLCIFMPLFTVTLQFWAFLTDWTEAVSKRLFFVLILRTVILVSQCLIFNIKWAYCVRD